MVKIYDIRGGGVKGMALKSKTAHHEGHEGFLANKATFTTLLIRQELFTTKGTKSTKRRYEYEFQITNKAKTVHHEEHEEKI